MSILNLMDNALSVVDLERGEEVKKIPAGEGTHGVAVTGVGDKPHEITFLKVDK